ncbi:MAG: hypothetical protein CMC07_10650 [Flavobacteriaceae bacterium]|jgi:nucleotide-binding universal stress UspA family protein|nr:hypothetical protein [Flavobacteriaceae bacterium]HBY66512.1 hypothetical protein [Flavobacteriaceae bacterium]|tara:strand:+ start:54182 stop:55027 length:846 start_codon:yes stop_codon:yes gene_type:complete
MKKILIPTDFSNNAYAALFYVVKLFSDEEVQFYLLHSFADSVSALTSRVDIGKSEKVLDNLYDNADEEGTKLIHRINLDSGNKSHSFEFISTSMSLVRATNKLIVKYGIDLVVMGTKGRTGAEDVLMGSNTIQVIKKIKNAPLLIVPHEIDFIIPSEIAFATDYKEAFPTAGIAPVLTLAKTYQSTVHLVHIGEKAEMKNEQEQHLKLIKKKLSDCKVKTHWIEKEESIANSIDSFVINEGIDLLVMVYHRYNAIARIFREAVVKKIGKTTSVPYIVIPIK